MVFVTSGSAALTSPFLLLFLQDRFTTNLYSLAAAFAPAGLILSVLPAHLGRLSDRLGRAPLMVMGFVGSGAASLLLPRVPTLAWLIVVATIKALGIAMVAPAQKALFSDLTGSAQRGTGYGLYGFAGSLGVVVGPLLGGWLYDAVGPIHLFCVNGLLLLASAAWVRLLLWPSPTNLAKSSVTSLRSVADLIRYASTRKWHRMQNIRRLGLRPRCVFVHQHHFTANPPHHQITSDEENMIKSQA